ncbi:hypothetical protein D3C78_1185000 [compost metagenome]
MNVRMVPGKTLEIRDQPTGAEGRLGGHLEHLGSTAVGEDVTAGDAHLSQDLVHLRQIQLACRGQLQAPAYAMEQQVLKHFLQLRHLLADGALGQVQLLRGPGETQVPGGGLEALEGGHGGKQAFRHGLSRRGSRDRSFSEGMMC